MNESLFTIIGSLAGGNPPMVRKNVAAAAVAASGSTPAQTDMEAALGKFTAAYPTYTVAAVQRIPVDIQ